MHQHPEQRGRGECFVDGIGEAVAGRCCPRADPHGGGSGRGQRGCWQRFVDRDGVFLHVLTCRRSRRECKYVEDLKSGYGAESWSSRTNSRCLSLDTDLVLEKLQAQLRLWFPVENC